MSKPNDPEEIIRQSYGAETVEQIKCAFDHISKTLLFEHFLNPVLSEVWQHSGENRAEVARQIGVEKSTTYAWPWPDQPTDKNTLKVRVKPEHESIPKLRPYFSLFAVYGLDPSDLLPHGRDVLIDIWTQCFAYVDAEVHRPCVGRQVRRDELFCLHICRDDSDWQIAERTQSQADYDKAAPQIIRNLESFCSGHQINSTLKVREVYKQWSPHFLLVAGLLKLGWSYP